MSKQNTKHRKEADASQATPWPRLSDVAQKRKTTADTSPPPIQRQEDEIRQCAFLLWEAAGQPPGDGVNFWYEAERRLGQAT